ncbi:carboxylesterase [Microcoleus sp. FACHB-831]|uniref:alpha/beta hydrolase n=1 Tax=Microcoleus sp. FACHB-831 TaxID=2692827 RepID=UPI001F54FB2C|nr:alpha/beta fold hydrolase [Microcoleus sp. FACHB-831]
MTTKMFDYSAFTAAMIRDIKAYEDALPVMHEKCRSQFFLHQEPTSKVCLFFHGFTATPEQFVPIGKAFFKAGYNVLIPLLPGHGIAGNWNADNPPPLPENPEVYQQFGIHWLQKAQALGRDAIVGGLSGGSTLAGWLAVERAVQINRALLFAPYLSGTNKLVDLVVQIFNIYFEWKTKPGVTSFGYDGFLMPSLRLFLDMGEDIIQQVKKREAAPMFIVSSDKDLAVGKEEHEDLFKAAIAHQPQCWYHCFDRSLDIGHNMMTEAEGNDDVDLVIAIAKAYVESDLTWAEVEKIGDRIKQGYSFNAAVNELNLTPRVSVDMPTMMALFTNFANVRERQEVYNIDL